MYITYRYMNTKNKNSLILYFKRLKKKKKHNRTAGRRIRLLLYGGKLHRYRLQDKFSLRTESNANKTNASTFAVGLKKNISEKLWRIAAIIPFMIIQSIITDRKSFFHGEKKKKMTHLSKTYNRIFVRV